MLLLIRKLLLTLRPGRFPHFLLDLWVVWVALIFNIKIVNPSAKSCQSCSTLRSHGLKPTRLLCPWDSPGKDTGVGCHFLLQGIFLTQGSNLRLLCLLHWQGGSLPLASPRNPYTEPQKTKSNPEKKEQIWRFHTLWFQIILQDFPGGPVVRNSPASTGDTGSIPGPGRSHMPWGI